MAEFKHVSSTGDLLSVLLSIHAHPPPTIPNPPSVTKRASVAVIIRLHPSSITSAAPPSASPDVATSLRAYLSHPGATDAIPEILFIKRASRASDRWNGHVALPGGRRDPEDGSDAAAAIRETLEEVGLSLDEPSCIPVGALPQRIVTTSWGKVPLMVLCPFVYLITSGPASRGLTLQPSEVASAHWVPLAALQEPSLRTLEYQDVSNRLARQEKGLRRVALRAMLGDMAYAAVRLVPTESHYSPAAVGYYPGAEQAVPPLHLWGLTLTVIADLLHMLPPHDVLALWSFPTFTAWDVRAVVWAVTRGFRSRMRERIEGEAGRKGTLAIELGLGEVPNRMGIEGVGAGGNGTGVINALLEEYYPLLRTGVVLAVAMRGVVGVAVGWAVWRRFKR